MGVSVLLVSDFDCWKSRIKLLCRILLSVRRVTGPIQHFTFSFLLLSAFHFTIGFKKKKRI